MKIEIRETARFLSCGSHFPKEQLASSFEVVAVNRTKTAVLFKNDQFDSFNSFIRGTRQKYLAEAQKMALHLGETLDAEVEINPIAVPDEVELLQKRINDDQKRLAELLAQRKVG